MWYRDMMFKKKPSPIDWSIQKKKPDVSSLSKLSAKQKLAKLFMTSDVKNRKLRKPLRAAKSELITNFHDGGVDVDKVNTLFWVYFHDHKDVFIPRYLKWFSTNCVVFVDRMWEETSFSLYTYLRLLKHIRVEIEPFTKQIQQLLAIAKEHARKETDDQEEEMEQYSLFTKQKFSNLLTSTFDQDGLYTEEWFMQTFESIWATWDTPWYKELILFAILGMHYFDKKHMVYKAFDTRSLASSLMFSVGSQKKPESITITLEEFLALIDQLNFKKHFFAL